MHWWWWCWQYFNDDDDDDDDDDGQVSCCHESGSDEWWIPAHWPQRALHCYTIQFCTIQKNSVMKNCLTPHSSNILGTAQFRCIPLHCYLVVQQWASRDAVSGPRHLCWSALVTTRCSMKSLYHIWLYSVAIVYKASPHHNTVDPLCNITYNI